MTRIALATILATLLGTAAAQSATLFSDNFDGETQALNGSLSKWTVSNGSIDVIGAGFFDFFPGNGNYLDMDGSTGDGGRITTTQIFTFNLGVSYQLTFDVGRNLNNSTDEVLDFGASNFFNSITVPVSQTTLTQVVFNFIGDGTSGAYFFETPSADNGGPVIDNVRVASVPLPAALPLLALALGGLGLIGRRRRAA